MQVSSSKTTALVLMALFLGAIVALGYTRWLRVHLVPEEFGFIPAESNIVLATGDIVSLWDGVEFHFGRILREDARESGLRQALDSTRDFLTDQGVPILQRSDLETKYGIDTSRGVLAGFSQSIFTVDQEFDVEYSFTLVVPLLAPDESSEPGMTPARKFESFLRNLLGEEDQDHPCAGQSPLTHDENQESENAKVLAGALGMGDFILAFPGNDAALLSTSCAFLRNSIDNSTRNLTQARQDDNLFEVVRYMFRRPLMKGAGALVHLRSLSLDFTPAITASATLNFSPDAVLVDARVESNEVEARLVDDILRSPSPERPWRHLLSAETGALLLLRDYSISNYVDFVSDVDGCEDWFSETFGGLLHCANSTDNLDQLVLAVSEYRDGIPLMLLGLWGDEGQFEQHVLESQIQLRENRDETVLGNAMDEWLRIYGKVPQSLDAVVDSLNLDVGAICGNSDRYWLGRYELKDGALSAGSFDAGAFESDEYQSEYRGRTIRFLDPCVNDNDIRFRLDLDADSPAKEMLLENRYRMASTHLDGTLWIASSRPQIEDLIDRWNDPVSGTGFRLDDRDRPDKLRLITNVSSLIEHGLLSGESSLQEQTEKYLLDFRYHSEIVSFLEPLRRGKGLHLRVEARGPSTEAAK